MAMVVDLSLERLELLLFEELADANLLQEFEGPADVLLKNTLVEPSLGEVPAVGHEQCFLRGACGIHQLSKRPRVAPSQPIRIRLLIAGE